MTVEEKLGDEKIQYDINDATKAYFCYCHTLL